MPLPDPPPTPAHLLSLFRTFYFAFSSAPVWLSFFYAEYTPPGTAPLQSTSLRPREGGLPPRTQFGHSLGRKKEEWPMPCLSWSRMLLSALVGPVGDLPPTRPLQHSFGSSAQLRTQRPHSCFLSCFFLSSPQETLTPKFLKEEKVNPKDNPCRGSHLVPACYPWEAEAGELKMQGPSGL